MSISARLPRRAIEPAELAIDVANIGRIEMAVNVEICRAAVLRASHRVSKLAQAIEIVSGEQRDAVFE